MQGRLQEKASLEVMTRILALFTMTSLTIPLRLFRIFRVRLLVAAAAGEDVEQVEAWGGAGQSHVYTLSVRLQAQNAFIAISTDRNQPIYAATCLNSNVHAAPVTSVVSVVACLVAALRSLSLLAAALAALVAVAAASEVVAGDRGKGEGLRIKQKSIIMWLNSFIKSHVVIPRARSE